MHGYFGNNKEMKGIYVIKKEGKKKNLNAKELHGVLKGIKNGRE
jgi:hypothetical protein